MESSIILTISIVFKCLSYNSQLFIAFLLIFLIQFTCNILFIRENSISAGTERKLATPVKSTGILYLHMNCRTSLFYEPLHCPSLLFFWIASHYRTYNKYQLAALRKQEMYFYCCFLIQRHNDDRLKRDSTY